MSFFNQWVINVFQDEYLEIVLPDTVHLIDKQRIYYLHDSRYLTCFVHPKDDHLIYFDCGSMMSLKQYVSEHKVSQSLFIEWLILIRDIFENGDIIFDSASYIFVDAESHQLHFCLLPVKGFSYRPETAFQNCLWTILEDINFDGDEAWLSRLYMMTKHRSFRFSMLNNFLEQKEERHFFSFFFKKKRRDEDDFFTAYEVREQEVYYGSDDDLKTTMMQDDLKTQVLMAGFQYGYLESENHETFLISASPWLIGRQGICHLCLKYPEVSKQHAKITIETGRCYIEDLGSTNQTLLNHDTLIPAQKQMLHDLDVISFAGHSFIYHE